MLWTLIGEWLFSGCSIIQFRHYLDKALNNGVRICAECISQIRCVSLYCTSSHVLNCWLNKSRKVTIHKHDGREKVRIFILLVILLVQPHYWSTYFRLFYVIETSWESHQKIMELVFKFSIDTLSHVL